MKELTRDATIENITAVTSFVDKQLERLGCPPESQAQIDIAIDERFSNIAYYAYNPETGPATVRVAVIEEPLSVEVTFIDSGVKYNPLAKDDLNLSLSADERQIGGLGIYIVKNSMDAVTYEYKDGKNILRIRKNIPASGSKGEWNEKAAGPGSGSCTGRPLRLGH